MPDFLMENIYKSFNGVKALQGATFSSNKGEVVALLGENGAGKSTFVKILSGVVKADAGEITLFGNKINISNPNDAIKHGICAVYQELSLIPDLSVAENIFIGRYDKSAFGMVSKVKLIKMTEDLFEKYQVKDINPNAKVSDLSLPKRQMIEIIKNISRDFQLIVFDEATSALSEKNVIWLRNLIKSIANENKIVIFISHRMSEVKEFCDKIVIFRNGVDVGHLDIEETDSSKLVNLMLGRKMSGFFPEKENNAKEKIVLETKNLSTGNSLKNIDIQLKAGEILGVGGLSGQGQAELFLSLYGSKKVAGEVYIYNKKVNIRHAAHSLSEGVALIPEDRALQGLIMPFSINYNITLSSLNKLKKGLLLSKKKEKDISTQMINRLSIKAESADTPVNTLSGGNQQKVVLAKQLAVSPRILLMYDITRGVDVGTKREIFNLMMDFTREGNSILMYSTDVEELVNICNRILVMYEGTVVDTLEGCDITKENIIHTSVGEKIVHTNGL